jgi:hypothetical protein
MKSYDVKFEIGQDVFTLMNKKILKSKIDKIRITEQRPCKIMKDNKWVNDKTVKIEYLLLVEQNDRNLSYDYFDQDDVAASKEEILSKL